ncbi:MAG: hypothetical protein NTW61_03350, partial [Candidatus Melainabacteria bacterium]|nr:hypothetical protein [Candidatus Melainabacteria bacterium]
DGGMFFLPLRWTERIGSCRANAMVVPTGWFERLRYLNCQLVLVANLLRFLYTKQYDDVSIPQK